MEPYALPPAAAAVAASGYSMESMGPPEEVAVGTEAGAKCSGSGRAVVISAGLYLLMAVLALVQLWRL